MVTIVAITLDGDVDSHSAWIDKPCAEMICPLIGNHFDNRLIFQGKENAKTKKVFF